MNTKQIYFSNTNLKNMIVPLFLEQLLLMLVGMADVLIVSFVGETAVSGVSLVNSFNTIFLNLFTALASGGAVVISQYIGKKEQKKACVASSQLLNSSILLSIVVTIFILIFNESLMRLIFGRVENEVMEACVTYLRISAYSYPALAIYNAGAALYRSFGKTSTTMYISILANIINVIGNMIGVFVLHAGVAGVAWPSLISRSLSAVMITILCFSKHNLIWYDFKWLYKIDRHMQGVILKIAIPNGIESGIFQFVKVALSSIVAMFGTYQIAANGVAQSIWSISALVCIAMGPVFITVIGRCMGAKDSMAAEYYFKKLLKISVLFAVGWNILIFVLTPVMLQFYSLNTQTKELIIWLVLIHNIFNAFVFPFADPLGKGLRATGDVMFTTTISLFTTIVVRLVFSILFGIVFDLGVIGITIAMCMDWSIRGIIFWIRLKRNKWKKLQIIE